MKLQNATVLVVEDEPLLLELIARWFEREGCRVIAASNGAVGLQAISSNPVDLIVTDICMPELDGISMLKAIKDRGSCAPSIVFVNSFSDSAPREAGDIGTEATFLKPVVRQLLITTAEQILMERDLAWRTPWQGETGAELPARFESLATALSLGQIAFGRGGFQIMSSLPLPIGPVRFAIEFTADHQVLSGHGNVRWSAPQERRVGVEILSLDEASQWVIRHLSENATRSFIPGATIANQSARKVTGGIPHEIGNLLGVIIAYSQVCKETLNREEPTWTYLDRIESCAESALALNRLSAGSEAPLEIVRRNRDSSEAISRAAESADSRAVSASASTD